MILLIVKILYYTGLEDKEIKKKKKKEIKTVITAKPNN